MNAKRSGFTIVELMIVVAIIAIIVAIATPYYAHYRRASIRSACIANMKELDAAVTLAQLHGVAIPDRDTLMGANGEIGYLMSMPTCPANGAEYTAFFPPTCPAGIADHVMPPD
jgi:prepilin-type N-terminal cleavage/methylation domain-containing protein